VIFSDYTSKWLPVLRSLLPVNQESADVLRNWTKQELILVWRRRYLVSPLSPSMTADRVVIAANNTGGCVANGDFYVFKQASFLGDMPPRRLHPIFQKELAIIN